MSSRFNSSKNGSSNGDCLKPDLNLKDIQSVEKTIENLGLSITEIFATDSLINYNNLSDITDPIAARLNLQIPNVLTDITNLQTNQTTISNLATSNDIAQTATDATVSNNTSQITALQSTASGHTTLLGTHTTNHITTQGITDAHTISIGEVETQQTTNTTLLSDHSTLLSDHTTEISDIKTLNIQQTADIKTNYDDIITLMSAPIGELATLSTQVSLNTTDIGVNQTSILNNGNRLTTLEALPQYDASAQQSQIIANSDNITLIEAKNTAQDTSILALETKNTTQDTSISDIETQQLLNKNNITDNSTSATSNANFITTLNSSETLNFKKDGSRQMTNDIIFSGGIRYIKQLEKNMMALNYTDNSVSISNLGSGLIRSVGGKMINGQLSINDIDAGLITGDKLTDDYFKTDCSKQLTGDLGFNAGVKSIRSQGMIIQTQNDHLGVLNPASTSLILSNNQIRILSSGNIAIGNYNVPQYYLPTVKSTGANQVLTDTLGDGYLSWEDNHTASDLSNYKLNGTRQITGANLDFNAGLKNIRSQDMTITSQINHTGTLEPASSSIKIKTGGIELLTSGNIAFGSFDTVQYNFPSTRATAPNQMLIDLLGNGSATWQNIPESVDTANKVSKGGDTGALTFGTTTADDLSIISNNIEVFGTSFSSNTITIGGDTLPIIQLSNTNNSISMVSNQFSIGDGSINRYSFPINIVDATDGDILVLDKIDESVQFKSTRTPWFEFNISSLINLTFVDFDTYTQIPLSLLTDSILTGYNFTASGVGSSIIFDVGGTLSNIKTLINCNFSLFTYSTNPKTFMVALGKNGIVIDSSAMSISTNSSTNRVFVNIQKILDLSANDYLTLHVKNMFDTQSIHIPELNMTGINNTGTR